MNKNIAYAVVALVVVAGLAVYAFGPGGFSGKAKITSIITARGIDAQGNPVGATASFDQKKDNIVYAIIGLKNATKQTKVSYIRYYKGKYVDSKVTVPGKNGVNSVYFVFEKGSGMYLAGDYKLVTYVDGTRSLETTFTFH